MKVLTKEHELGRKLTLEEQDELKSEAMEEAFLEASRKASSEHGAEPSKSKPINP